MGSKKTKAELIAENEAMRHRLETLENRPGNERRVNNLTRIFIAALANFGFAFDGHGRILQVLTGKHTSKTRVLEGRLLADILPQKDAAELGNALRRTFDTGEAQHFEFILSVMAGRRWYQVSSSLVLDQNRDEKIAVLLFQDVTNQKLAEGVLKLAHLELEQQRGEGKRSENQFHTLIEYSLQAIYIHDRHRFLYVNQAFSDLFGYRNPQEVLEVGDVLQFYALSERDRLLGYYRARISGGAPPVRYEFQGQRKDGSLIWLENLVQVVIWEGKQAILATIIDISSRKRAEDALRDSEEKYQQLYDNAPDMFVSVDAETGDIIKCNQTFVRNIGYTTEEILGQHISEFYHPDSKEERKKVFHQFVTLGEVNDAELQLQRSNGSKIDVSLSISAIRDSQGDIIYSNSIWRDITERKRAEEALRTSEERFRDLVEGSIEGIIVHRDFKQLFVNQAAASIFGYDSSEEMLAMGDHLNIFAPHERSRAKNYYQTRLSGGEAPTQFEFQGLRKDGSLIWLENLARPVLWDEEPAVQATLYDITERKRAQRAQQITQEYLDSILFHLPVGVAILEGPDFIYYRINQHLADLNGIPVGDHLGRPLAEVLPHAKDSIIPNMREIMETGVPILAREFSITLPKDPKIPVHLIDWLFPIKSPEGLPSAIGAVVLDITERKRAEEELLANERLLQTVFDTIPHWLFVKDRESRYLMVNSPYAESFYRKPGDFMGVEATDIMNRPAEELNHLMETDHEVWKIGERVDIPEIITTLPTGARQIHRAIKLPLRDDAGNVIGLVGVSEDITDHKSLEEQLRQSQKMEALGTLAGGIAHDFNNMLYPIIGFSELLLEKWEAGSEEYSYLTHIRDSAHRAKDLVSQILIFSRRSQTAKSICDLVPVAKEVIKLVRSTLPKSIAIEKKVSKDSVPVFCDPSQIHQVLLNLCVNAGQAIPGIGKIKIALETIELEGFECFDGTKLFARHVRLAVTDSGVGMDKETLSQIFDPFFTTKEVGKGTGLGLSTVFGIVQNHGGGIAVSSEPGEGTTFEVFLPLAEGNIEKLSDTPDPVQDNGSENILFVDDEEAITNLGRISLERIGYNVTTVSDGQKALEIFAANPERFNLVVTDQTMPNMTGETLAHELLKLRPEIPIILCTGHSEAISPERSKFSGISSFLYKPITLKELGRVVREVLHQAKEVSPRT